MRIKEKGVRTWNFKAFPRPTTPELGIRSELIPAVPPSTLALAVNALRSIFQGWEIKDRSLVHAATCIRKKSGKSLDPCMAQQARTSLRYIALLWRLGDRSPAQITSISFALCKLHPGCSLNLSAVKQKQFISHHDDFKPHRLTARQPGREPVNLGLLGAGSAVHDTITSMPISEGSNPDSQHDSHVDHVLTRMKKPPGVCTWGMGVAYEAHVSIWFMRAVIYFS